MTAPIHPWKCAPISWFQGVRSIWAGEPPGFGGDGEGSEQEYPG